MAARYVEIPAADMEALMTECGFDRIYPPRTVERTYQRPRIVPGPDTDSDFAIRVYTTITDQADAAREVGTDAIRVVLIHLNTGKPVWAATRVHRTQGWREKTRERMREAWVAVSGLKRCPQCARPMVLRRTKDKSRQFYGCVGYPECKGTQSYVEEVRS